MKLSVGSDGYMRRAKVSVYSIEPARRRPNMPLARRFYPQDLRRLKTLLPRIERMARRQLGKYLKVVRVRSLDGTIAFSVKPGTSTVKRFEMREFIGWVNVFDTEHAKA